MIQNFDHGSWILKLKQENEELRNRIDRLEEIVHYSNEDWDNSDLMRNWKISKRTTANYREKGLEYYKQGGRIYYTADARNKFRIRFNIS